MVLVAHGHGGSAVAGHNLHGVLCRMDGGVRREQRFVDEVLIVRWDISRCVVGVTLFIVGLGVVLILANVTGNVCRIGTVVSNIGSKLKL